MNGILREIPQEVFDFFRYEPDAGKIYWKKRSGMRGVPGKEAGHVNKSGYVEIRLNKTTYQAHRIAWALFHGTTKVPAMLDHINNRRTDNRIKNLRPATAQQNPKNQKLKQGGTSPFKGVSWHKKSQKWQAQIRSDNKSIHLGTYDHQEDAYFAYCKAAAELHGDFANFG